MVSWELEQVNFLTGLREVLSMTEAGLKLEIEQRIEYVFWDRSKSS